MTPTIPETISYHEAHLKCKYVIENGRKENRRRLSFQGI
jgi:hypothetical protein